MAGDWIKLHRKILDSRVFSDEKTLKVFVWCLCRANYRDQFFKGESLPAGSFATGRITGSQECAMHSSSFYRALKRLEDWKIIETKSNSKWTTVSVCNWQIYQSIEVPDRTANEQQMNSQRTTGEQLANTIEEGKEFKERKNTGRKRACVSDFEEHSDTFQQFWDAYPSIRKTGKRAAWLAWQKAIKRADATTILEASAAFAGSPLGQSRFCPSPAPWLNQDRWEDDRTAWQHGGEETSGHHEPVDEPYPEH